MTNKQIVKQLKKANPYPESIFPDPTAKEWDSIAMILKANNISPDRVFAKWGRMVWNNCINQFKELVNDDTD